MYKSLG